MTKATFEALVSKVINRGTRYNSDISSYVQHALSFLERNYSFKYMERYVGFTLDAGSAQPELMPYPTRIKSMRFMRLIKSDGAFLYLTQADPQQITFNVDAVDVGDWPAHYYIDGDDFIWLDRRVVEDTDGDLMYYQKSLWSDIASDGTHWFLENAEDVLLAQTIIHMGPMLRAPDLMQIYSTQLPMLMKTLAVDQEEMKNSDRVEQAEFGRDFFEEAHQT